MPLDFTSNFISNLPSESLACAPSAPNPYKINQGRANNASGKMAEQAVCKDYVRRGHKIEARRWRSKHGEIDIIVQTEETLVFVEVKRARDFARAAERLGASQQKRIYNAAAEFLATHSNFSQSDVRFDVALVNAHGAMEFIENAIGF